MPASIVLFRGLIVLSVVTGVVGAFTDVMFPALIPKSLSVAFEALPPPGLYAIVGASVLLLITFGGFVTATVGLYMFQPWSRGLAIVMTLLSLLAYPLLGVSIQSGWAQLLLESSSMLWGAVLAMSYVSSISQRFAAAQTNLRR